MQPAPDITELLAAWTGGDREALDALMPCVIDELKRIAGKYLANEPHARTLQTTALVNEAYLRLAQVRPHAWENRGQFYALTAKIMRRILVDHARLQLAGQRGGRADHVALDAGMVEQLSGPQSLVGLDDALLSLERMDSRKSRIVELRVFGGIYQSGGRRGARDFRANHYPRVAVREGMAGARIELCRAGGGLRR